jgi:MFS family permease
MTFSKALRYLLRIRTNVALIAALALGYFFLGGARTFGVVFVRGQYDLDQASGTAVAALLGAGALAGLLIAGRAADRLLHRGRVDARVLVGAVGFLAAAVLFIAPILISSALIALPLFIFATAALTAPTAPLDAALLDVIPPSLWGRAEGLQTAVRTIGLALAPVTFGFLADVLGSTGAHSFGQGTFGSGSSAAQGLQLTFLIMLVPVGLAGAILLLARRSYSRDAASASGPDERPGVR